MSDSVVERPLEPGERARLAERLAHVAARRRRGRDAVGAAALVFCAMSLVVVLAWSAIAWIVRTLFAFEVGPFSAAMLPWFAGMLAVLAVFAIVSTWRARLDFTRQWDALRADEQAGRVVEEHYEFDAAQAFQEQEYGGLIYFLRIVDGRVFVTLDEDSQDRGARGGDPLASKFRPCCRLVIARAPISRIIVDRRFSGATLACPEPIDLMLPPRQWPAFDSVCDIAWADLHTRLAGR